MKDPTSLKTILDPSILPEEYGGTMPIAEMIELFKKHIMKQRSALLALDDLEIEIDDGKETKYSEWSDIETGMIGSFRKLQFD